MAAMIVSPTYFGAVGRRRRPHEVAHGRGVPLVVDKAWARICTSPPPCHRGARMRRRRRSLLGAQDRRLDHPVGDPPPRRPATASTSASSTARVTWSRSTSPNAILTASLDAARRQAATRGRGAARRDRRLAALLRARIRSIPGLDVLDERIVGRAGVHDYDPLRLVVDVRGTGATGHRIARLMREQDDIDLELFAENVVVAVFGIGERASETGRALVDGLEHACARLGEEEEEPLPPFAEPPPWGPTELSPREAFLDRAGGGRLRRGGGPDRRRVARRLPTRGPERPPRRAPDPTDALLHRRQRRPRRPRPRRV